MQAASLLLEVLGMVLSLLTQKLICQKPFSACLHHRGRFFHC